MRRQSSSFELSRCGGMWSRASRKIKPVLLWLWHAQLFCRFHHTLIRQSFKHWFIIRIRTRRSKCMHFGVVTAHVRLTMWRVHPIIVASLQNETFDRIQTQFKLESIRFVWPSVGWMIALEINLTPLQPTYFILFY